MQRFLATVLLPLVALGALSACRASPLVVPDPIVLEEPRSDVREVILRAMATRGWRLKGEEGNTIQAQLAVRSHVGVVDITYTKTEIEFNHVSSANLDESVSESGEKRIHSNYNTWLANLRTDIELEFGLVPPDAGAGS